MFNDKIKHGEVALSITYYSHVILQLQQADIAMVILKRFELQLGAILGFQCEAIVAAFMSANVFIKASFEVFEERGISVGPLAVRPPLSIHLQQTQINPQLDFFLAVFGFESPDDHLAGLVVPMLQQIRYIEVHAEI